MRTISGGPAAAAVATAVAAAAMAAAPLRSSPARLKILRRLETLTSAAADRLGEFK